MHLPPWHFFPWGGKNFVYRSKQSTGFWVLKRLHFNPAFPIHPLTTTTLGSTKSTRVVASLFFKIHIFGQEKATKGIFALEETKKKEIETHPGEQWPSVKLLYTLWLMTPFLTYCFSSSANNSTLFPSLQLYTQTGQITII